MDLSLLHIFFSFFYYQQYFYRKLICVTRRAYGKLYSCLTFAFVSGPSFWLATFCGFVLLCFFLFVSLLCPMLIVSLDYPSLIADSSFTDIYVPNKQIINSYITELKSCHRRSSQYTMQIVFVCIVFVCAQWCSTHIVYFFLRLVYLMLPVSPDCPFLIDPSIFANVYARSLRFLLCLSSCVLINVFLYSTFNFM